MENLEFIYEKNSHIIHILASDLHFLMKNLNLFIRIFHQSTSVHFFSFLIMNYCIIHKYTIFKACKNATSIQCTLKGASHFEHTINPKDVKKPNHTH